jgi:methyl-accepting chemotaxis protein
MSRLADWHRNASVRTKILLGYAPVLLLMVLAAVVVLVQGVRVARQTQDMNRVDEVRRVAADLDDAVAERTLVFREFLLSGQDASLVAFDSAQTAVAAGLSRLQRPGFIRDPAQEARVDTIRVLAQEWVDEVALPGIALRRATLEPGGPGMDAVVAFFAEGAGRRRAARSREVVSRFVERQGELAAGARDAVVDSVRSMRDAAIVFTALAALAALGLAYWLSAQIAWPLDRAVRLAEAIAEGDLTARAEVGGRDETGRVIGAMNAMAENLQSAVGDVSRAAVQVAAAAEEIAASSQRLAETTDDQVAATEQTSTSMEEIASQIARVAGGAESLAASVDQTSTSIAQIGRSMDATAGSAETLAAAVEQTSSTVEEMAVSIRQVSRHVEETHAIAKEARESAQGGGRKVESTLGGMRRIHTEMERLTTAIRQLDARGESVGRISETIEDIADQTNLLALNAAIEAARAGEHGRGFAVVAQEIRRLAERSVDAAREIGSTIRAVRIELEAAVRSGADVSERTQEGIGLAEEAAEALEVIEDTSARTTGVMDQVSLAAEQQTLAAGQAQDAIRHIQQIAGEVRVATREQQTATRQIVSATENMNQQTQEVFAATAEQKRGGDMILKATESIAEGARQAQSTVREAGRAARDVSEQATTLTELVRRFRV